MTFTYADIVPLIGGMSLAQGRALGGKRPEYIASYSPFEANDSHLLNYYDHEVPYIVLDKGQSVIGQIDVDIIAATCPCAGLSQMHHSYGDHNENNKWMIATAETVLSDIRPKVFWGENAPGLIGKIGAGVRSKLIDIGHKNGYSFHVYKTKSLYHGTPQVRARTFYFFWKNGKIPLLQYFRKPYQKIEDLILSCAGSNSFMDPINKKIPSKDDPYYRYILEVIHGGMTHAQFASEMPAMEVRGNDVLSYIERYPGQNYDKVAAWMGEQGLPKEVEKCIRRRDKLAAGGNIMRRTTIVPRGHIGAFVGHYPTSLTHPVEDRYITYREAMTIMGLPQDFELLNPEKSSNHICQNVPHNTAFDMATEVVAALSDERQWVDSNLLYQFNDSKTHEDLNTRKINIDNFFV